MFSCKNNSEDMIYGWFDINKNMNLNCHSTIPSCKPNMHCINNNLPPPLHMANHIMAQVLQIFGSLNMKHDKSASFNLNTRSKGRAALVKLSPKFTSTESFKGARIPLKWCQIAVQKSTIFWVPNIISTLRC